MTIEELDVGTPNAHGANEEGIILDLEVPEKWEICGNCRGNGKHVNPAIDGHGLTREDFDEDPDFEEGYFSGRYDVICQAGCSDGKIRVPDTDMISDPVVRKAVEEWIQTDHEMREEAKHERDMGY